MEIKIKQNPEFEIRENIETNNPIVCGYAVIFDEAEDMGDYLEKINVSAVDDEINSKDVSFLWSHDTSKPMASTRNGTLTLRKDNKGLWFEAELNKNLSYVKDALENIRTGMVKNMSFGFKCTNDIWTGTRQKPCREIMSMIIGEISAILNPAFESTSLFQLRSKEDVLSGCTIPEEVKEEPILLTDEQKALKNKILDLELI